MLFLSRPIFLLFEIIAVISAVCTAAIAHYTGRRFWPSFWGGFFFGPLAVVFALIFFIPKRWRGVRW
jgi:hypothetical protein